MSSARRITTKAIPIIDESVKYLELSIAEGYVASDSREYLALAYVAARRQGEGDKNFEAALEKSRADLLLISAAKAYVDAGEPVKAEALLLEVLAKRQGRSRQGKRPLHPRRHL